MRMELHLGGHDIGLLGSPRDITLRRFLAKQKIIESNKLMVSAAASFNNEDVVKTSYKKFQNSLWYEDISDNKNTEMKEYYDTHVKHLRPQLYLNEDGKTAVKGLDI